MIIITTILANNNKTHDNNNQLILAMVIHIAADNHIDNTTITKHVCKDV
jgi:hypothetical protein